MATIREAQERVLEIALSLPDPPNLFVHLDLIAIALALQPAAAARLVEKIEKLCTGPGNFMIDDKAGELVSHLAKGGEPDAALRLATRVFRFSKQQAAPSEAGADPHRRPGAA